MHIPLSSTTSLTPRPSGKPPSAADCWDMRRAEWIDCTGCAVTAMSRVEANERRTDRRQNDPVRHPRASQTSSDAQRRPPSHADRGATVRPGCCRASSEQAWSLAHASEHVATTHGEMVDPWDVDDRDQ